MNSRFTYFTPLFVFLFFFLLVFLSRSLRLERSDAFVADEVAVLHLAERTPLADLIDHLSQLEVRFDEEELRWAAGLLGWRNFNPGRYEIQGSLGYDELLSRIALGIQDPAAVTILPGTTVGRLSASLGRQLRADSTQFAAIFSDSSRLAAELGITPERLFARMMPDTYHFYWTSDPEAVVRRVAREYETRMSRFAAEIESHSLDAEEILTLASIVEWEARHDHEKPRVSGLYLNRLRNRMRLQADPTIIYALGEHRRLLYQDYELDHPYNTYRFSGLPPGPITNPGMASLEAVIRPEKHDYLYMVASPDGGHVFTRTFDEHRLASAEWRRWLQEQYRIRARMEREREAQERAQTR